MDISGCTQQGGTITVDMPQATIYAGGIVGTLFSPNSLMHTCTGASDLIVTGDADFAYAGALVGYNLGKVYDCSTFLPSLTVTVNGTPQNPVKAIGDGSTETTPCEDASHTAQQ